MLLLILLRECKNILDFYPKTAVFQNPLVSARVIWILWPCFLGSLDPNWPQEIGEIAVRNYWASKGICLAVRRCFRCPDHWKRISLEEERKCQILWKHPLLWTKIKLVKGRGAQGVQKCWLLGKWPLQVPILWREVSQTRQLSRTP